VSEVDSIDRQRQPARFDDDDEIEKKTPFVAPLLRHSLRGTASISLAILSSGISPSSAHAER